MKEDVMKRIGKAVGIRMGIAMSIVLSFLGLLSSGRMFQPGWMIMLICNIIISTLISLLISALVPMGKVNASLARKWNLQPGLFKTRCVESLVSDLIYTPVITLAMVLLGVGMAKKNAPEMPFVPVFLSSFAKSFVICFAAGFVLIFFLMPLFLKQLMKKEGMGHAHDKEEES
ncbi:MAG: hypothetical protein K5739_02700 [Lachnospiraceae bacterium]|nr:hypothetical protein [Lachnospiraceae bacterium]